MKKSTGTNTLKIKASVKTLVAGLFILFLVYQLLQHSMVYLYHDDYGYATLRYGAQIGSGGMEYGLRDIFTYLRWHYLNWGGRILYFFYEILFLRLGGLTLIRIVQSIVITVIAYETYLLARGKGKDSLLLAFADILLWGTISIKVLREGVYWFTASVLYVWPIAFFLAGILLYKGGLSVKRGKARAVLLFLLFFMAGFSQEQVAVMVIAYCVLDILFCLWSKRKAELACLAGALAGGMTEILAPGNFVRASSDDNAVYFGMSIVEKLLHNVPRIININFGPQNIFYATVGSATVVMTGILLWKKERRKRLVAGAWLIGLLYPVCFLISRRNGMMGIWLYIVLFIWTIAAAVWLLWYFARSREYGVLALLIAGICSQAALLISPALNYRSAVIFELIFHCVALYVFGKFISMEDGAILKRVLFWTVLIIFSVCSCLNVMQTGLGYYRNARIHRDNDRILAEAADRVRDGEEVGSITVYKMYDDNYAEDMAYNKSYIEPWIKGYYELPAEVEFVYEEAWRRQ